MSPGAASPLGAIGGDLPDVAGRIGEGGGALTPCAVHRSVEQLDAALGELVTAPRPDDDVPTQNLLLTAAVTLPVVDPCRGRN